LVARLRAVYYGAGSYSLTRAIVGTRYDIAVVRFLVDFEWRPDFPPSTRKLSSHRRPLTRVDIGSIDHRRIEKTIPIESGAVGLKPNCA